MHVPAEVLVLLAADREVAVGEDRVDAVDGLGGQLARVVLVSDLRPREHDGAAVDLELGAGRHGLLIADL